MGILHFRVSEAVKVNVQLLIAVPIYRRDNATITGGIAFPITGRITVGLRGRIAFTIPGRITVGLRGRVGIST